MRDALLIAVLSVVAGALVGLLPRAVAWSRNIHTIAVVTAVVLVVGRIVPDAVAGGGLAVLVALAAGFFAPQLLARLAHSVAPSAGHRVGLELGYIGLAIHKVGDGVGLGTYASEAHAGHVHWDVMLAIAVHTIPIVAVITMVFARQSSVTSAVVRALGLAVCAGLGVAFASALADHSLHAWESWIIAAVGGLLLHVVAHGDHSRDSHDHDHGHSHDHDHGHSHGSPSLSLARRATEMVALVLGALLLWLGPAHSHAATHDVGHNHEASVDMVAAFFDLCLETAPALLFGLLAGATLQLWGGRIPASWLRGQFMWSQAAKGAVVGAPIPLCACGVLPITESLRAKGATPAFAVAFLLAAPELGVETFALTVQFLGWEFAVSRLVGALLLAFMTAIVIARFSPAHPMPATPREPLVAGGGGEKSARLFAHHFSELLCHIGPWTLLGLVVAAYAQVGLNASELRFNNDPIIDILIVTTIAVPSYICAASATPLAAVLITSGLSPGAALAGLLLGPATNVATFGFLSKAYGPRATTIGLGMLIAVTWLLAAIVDASVSPELLNAAQSHEHSFIALPSLILLAVAIVAGIWNRGLAGWFHVLATSSFKHKH